MMYTSKERAWKDVYFQRESVKGCILPRRQRRGIYTSKDRASGVYTSKERASRDVYFERESVEGCILPRRERRGM